MISQSFALNISQALPVWEISYKSENSQDGILAAGAVGVDSYFITVCVGGVINDV